ncbi:MAG: hypothetical protein Q9167_007199 [Letrouitia subvulpina]
MAQYIASNHMDMCRFSRFHDPEYRKVVAALDYIQRHITKTSAGLAPPGMTQVLGEDQRQNYLDALWFHAIDARYSTIKAAHASTCRWLLQRPEYQDWFDVRKSPDHHGLLWIKGKPGSGKSTLLKFVVANVRKLRKQAVVISFFFNARGETLERSTIGMYRSLLFQLFRALPDLQVVLDGSRSIGQCDEDTLAWEKSDLQSTFMAAIQELEKRQLICFIDALDECEEDQFRDLFEAIKEEILSRASGIFLWVALVVQILNKEYDHGRVHALRRRLRELPDGLDKLFEDILTRDQENKEELILCLQWILYATRPLKREELYYAILSGTDNEALATSNTETYTAQDMERFILSCSKGLAETTKSKAATVQFIHESVRDFLLGKNGFNMLKFELGSGQSHERLKQCCCVYIKVDISDYLSPETELPVAKSTEAKDLRVLVSRKFPFLDYVVRNVFFHADSANSQGISQKAFVERFALSDWILFNNLFEKHQVRRYTSETSLTYILAKQNLCSLTWTQLMGGLCADAAARCFKTSSYTAPLYVALAETGASEDMIRHFLLPVTQTTNNDGRIDDGQSNFSFDYQQTAIETIISNKPKLNIRKRQSLIGWAASNGHEAVVRLLLENANVDPDSKDIDSRTPLSWAAENGYEAVVRLLLENANVDSDSKDNDDRTPLSWAASNGHEAVVSLLLTHGKVYLNSRDSRGRTPLLQAAFKGKEAVVRLLLGNENVDSDLKDNDDRTPLSWAAENRHEAVVRLLLGNENVDCNKRDIYGNTPLSAAAFRGDEAVVRLLLGNENVDCNSKDIYGHTPLSLAAFRGDEAVVRLLLGNENIDCNSKDIYGHTPLSLAASNGQETVVRLRLSYGIVDFNSKDKYGYTPLSNAVLEGYEVVVNLLLEKESIELNSVDEKGRTPLSWAAYMGHEAIVKLLLRKYSNNLNFKDKTGQSPLSLAVSRGQKDVIKLLLAYHDIDLNSKDDTGRTPLSIAASIGEEAAVNLLLAENVDPNSRDNSGRTPLSLAALHGQEAIVRLLLVNSSIEINPKDSDGQTPLSLAALKGKENLVKLLLTNDSVAVSSKDVKGLTALHLAIQGMELFMTKMPDPDYIALRSGSSGVWSDYQQILIHREENNRCRLLEAHHIPHLEVVEDRLANPKIDLNPRDRSGQTPLSIAASNGQEAVIRKLLARRDIELNPKDHNGRTPLSLAVLNEHQAVVELLLTYDGIDLNSMDDDDKIQTLEQITGVLSIHSDNLRKFQAEIKFKRLVRRTRQQDLAPLYTDDVLGNEYERGSDLLRASEVRETLS